MTASVTPPDLEPLGGRPPVALGRAPAPLAARSGARKPAPDADPDVEILDVTKRFGSIVAVDRMTLRIAGGSFYSLLGPSGCGKTTTLRMIAGFEQPTEGEILLEGRPIAGVPPYRRNVNTVFQHYALFPHMDVARNVGYGLRQRKVGRQDEAAQVEQALRLVRLAGYGARRTWELSGGQQQRVALARALVNRPTVLLLDEPLGALDRKLRHEMQVELKALQQEVGITFVYVTHDQEEALTMSDVIVVMNEGRIHQQGGPEELYQRPINRFVAAFIGSSNFFDATLVDHDRATGRATVRTEGGIDVAGGVTDPGASPGSGDAVTIAVRPERFRVDAPDTGGDETAGQGWTRIPGRVRQGTYLGDQTEYRIETDAVGDLVVRRQNETADASNRTFGPGEPVVVSWHEEANLVLVD